MPDEEGPQPTLNSWEYEFAIGLYSDLTIQGAALEIAARDRQGRVVSLVPDHWQLRDPGRHEYGNQIPLNLGELQHVMNLLWDMGVRPSAGVASAGQAEAQKAHIQDLEKINDRLLHMLEAAIEPEIFGTPVEVREP